MNNHSAQYLPSYSNTPDSQSSAGIIQVDENLAVAVIAGGAGFVGSYLCDILVQQNCHVIVLDNLISGSKDNIKHLLTKPNFSFVQNDLKKPIELNVEKIDYIFHLAGLHFYSTNKKAQQELLLVNSDGTKNLLALAAKHHAKFLLGSTPAVYQGFISQTKLDSYYGKDRPVGKLLEAKRFAEGLVQQYFQEKNIDSRIVRFCDVYGPKMNFEESTVIGTILNSFQTSRKIKIPGAGDQMIYPTYITDLVYGLAKAMFSQSSSGKVYNLISLPGITALNFALSIKKMTSRPVEHGPVEGAVSSVVDEDKIAKSQKDLGWKPKVLLEEGLEETILSMQKASREVFLPEENNENIELKKAETIEKETPVDDSYLPFEDENIKPVKAQHFVKKQIVELEPEDKPELLMPKTEIKREISTGQSPEKDSYLPIVVEKKTKLFSFFSLFSKLIFKIKNKPKPTDDNSPAKPKKKHHKKLFAILILIFVLFFPFIITGAQLVMVKYNFNDLKKSFDQRDLAVLEKKSSANLRLINTSQKSLRFFSSYFRIFGLANGVEQLYQVLQVAKNASELSNQLGKASQNLETFVDYVLSDNQTGGDINKELDEIKLYLELIYKQAGFLQTEIENVYQSKAVEKLNLDKVFASYLEAIPASREKIYLAQEIVAVMPSLLGFDKKTTYLILLQNNMELRPTGGFIGSYALVTFDKGRLLDWQVFDVYDADGQLKGHVEPPESLKKYLGEANWYLRDSNWDPDFVISAKRAEWFLEKETGRKVDGVVGINLQTSQNLLKAVGPINLPEYNEMIDHNNIFERAEYYAEVNFFPGSTQKKDFLGSLSTGMLESIKNLDKEKWLTLLDQVLLSLNEKAIIVSSHDNQIAAMLGRYGWDGSLRRAPKTFINSNLSLDISDYLMVVDANVGVNKTNYFIEKDLNWEGNLLKEGQYQKKLTINYQNHSKSEAWPGGRYKNYCRLIVSKNNRLVSIKISDDQNNLIKIDESEIDLSVAEDKITYGFYFKVPAGEKKQVVVDFVDAGVIDYSKNTYRLGLFWQKQPGTANDKIAFKLSYPLFFKPVKVYPRSEFLNQQAVFTSDLSQDRAFYFEMIK